MNIKNDLEEIFREIFEDDNLEITENMTAEDIEEWDSLAHVQLVIASEKHFQVKFTQSEISELKSVGAFITLIRKKLML